MRTRYYIYLSLFFILSFSWTGITAQDTTAPTILQLVDSEPLEGQELAIDQPITLYFDHELDCTTAENAISIEPSAELDVACSAMQLELVPQLNLDVATTYILTISETLQGVDGAQLLDSETLEFVTTGDLVVSEVFPAPGEGIDTDTAITVIFNRPVVPLVTTVDMDTLPSPLSFSPAIEGTGEWINTSIYLFEPTEDLPGGTTYTVTVDAGLTATDGATLAEDTTWEFTTLHPEILSISPEDLSGDVVLQPRVQVRFNMAMNQTSVEEAFTLRPESEAVGESVQGEFEWSEDERGFSFLPDDLLALDTLHVATIDGAKAKNSDAEVVTTQWQFVTVPFPAVIGSEPFDGEQDASIFDSVRLFFSSPMDIESLPDLITIEPEPAFEPEFFYRDFNFRYTISFPKDASTTYTITLAPGAQDIYGNTIDSEYSVTFTTSALGADVQLQTPGSVGFYNAFREPVSLFMTYRNVSQIDLAMYEVPINKFLWQLSQYSYDPTNEYVPDRETLMREWVVTSDADPNETRFELLNLSNQEQCGPLPARVAVGDVAVVVTEPDGLRARAEPGGERLTLLYKDYQIPVVAGPVCQDDLRWWQVELRDGNFAWVAEGADDEYFIDVRIASDAAQTTITTADGDQLPPGVYYLTADAPEISGANTFVVDHMMMVSTANLVVKSSVDEVFVWATNVETGEPIPNAPITIYSGDFAEIAGSGVADETGLARIAVQRSDNVWVNRIAVLDNGVDFGVGFTEWTDGIEPYNFQQNYTFYPNQTRTYIYTDRPIYRPGQPVHFRGIVRDKDDVTYTVPDREVEIQVTDEDGETIYSETMELTPYGTFNGELMLSEDAAIGYYRINSSIPVLFGDDIESGGVSFTVAEFRLPEYQVSLDATEPEVVQGDMLELTLDAKYFFGGSVSNADVSYNVVTADSFFNYQGDDGFYDFIDFNYDEGPGEFYGSSGGLIFSGEGTTDEQGLLTFEIPGEFEDATQSQNFTIEASVTDETDQAVSARTSVIVHQGEVYIGVRAQQYISSANEEVGFDLIAVDWDSEPVTEQDIQVEAVERRWSSVQEQDEFGRTTWTYEVEEIPVASGSVTTDADGKATFSFTPENGGVYKVIITTMDDAGNRVRASTTTWVSSRNYVAWRQQNSNRIDLISDQTDYSVGDTAQILIASPFQGVTQALVTVERADVISTEVITLESNSTVYEVPITADFAPNVFVSVFIVKGVDDTNPVAAFRMGTIELGVDIEQKEMDIEITSDVDRAAPQQTVTYTVRTTDYQGEPVAAEVGVGVTDLAALSIMDANQGPMLPFFYGLQGLGIRTSTPLTRNTDELTQTTLDTIKGGGGGGFAEVGIIEIRGEFVDTPYWNGEIVTDENGEASFDVRLPDNLTTWRLDARAVTNGEDGVMLVGQDTFDLISTRPVIVRPVTPRFFVVGDELVVAAVVNNNTDENLAADVTMNATGVIVQDDATQTVTIPADGRTRVRWRVIVEDVELVNMTFVADAGEFTDGSISAVSLDDEGNLPVYKYEVPETIGTGGTLRSADSHSETILLPQRFDVTQGNLTIKVDQSLAGATIDGLDYLRNFEHQCIEQTVSRFLPNIMTFRALNNLGLADAELEANLETAANFAIQKLVAEQKPDGGWGWFVQDESNPLTTSYAIIGLVEARDQGLFLDGTVIQAAQNYVRNALIVPRSDTELWRLNRHAFMLYALAYSGSPSIARTSTLFDLRESLSLYGKAFLARTLHLIDPSDPAINTLVSDIVGQAEVSATGAFWEESQRDYRNWNTNLRTTAIILGTLIQTRPDSELTADGRAPLNGATTC